MNEIDVKAAVRERDHHRCTDGLRFAGLVRVSTEGQEKKGESLRTQGSQISDAITSLGGTLAARYGGQEHATAGYERVELDRLLADATSPHRPFDAVMVADPSRWSRDNVKSETGLDTLKAAGVRFFVLGTEYDLYDPQARLFLGMSSQIGAFQARVQKQKSILNRIARVKRGIPAVYPYPYGRVYDKQTGAWSIDPARRSIIADIASRYLGGEQLPKLAEEHGISHPQLTKILGRYLGTDWPIRFHKPDLRIDETVVMQVPPLLDEVTIKDVKARLKANRTYLHGRPKHDYLLSGCIFCAECGYSMFGQWDLHGDNATYRHAHNKRNIDCPIRPRPWVRASVIEEAAVSRLFEMFGSPAAIERAVRAATPDCAEELGKRERLEKELAAIAASRQRVIGLVARGLVSDAEADGTLAQLKKRDATLRQELAKVGALLAEVPDPAQVRQVFVDREEHLGHTYISVTDEDNESLDGGNDLCTYLNMTREDRKALVRAVFSLPLADGTPPGVYIKQEGQAKAHRPKRWTFTIKGRLDFECVVPVPGVCGVAARSSVHATAQHSHEATHKQPLPYAPFVLVGAA